MKSEKGITLMSLMVYVAVFLVVIIVVANISNFFYKNITTMDAESTSDYEYNKLNLYILEETKKKGNSILTISETIDESIKKDAHIEFASGNFFQYNSNTNQIYLVEQNKSTKIMLCENVQSCVFNLTKENSKDILTVKVTFTSEDYKGRTFETKYVLDYSNEYTEVQGNDEYIAN